ncbi:MAG TPA: LamG-like jellyroll fold domain-containing protein [Chitinophagales bacterium]|nr:LamG-like jellyroll fold domain-containing protein [Chitinophagales bacterium]
MKKFFACFISVLTCIMYVQAQSGLIACYPLDNSPNDHSGYNHDGTAYNLTPATDRFGNPNHAYHFSGSNSAVIIDDSAFMINSYTYSVWCKLDITPTPYFYFSVLAIGGDIADQSILVGNNPGNGGNIGIGGGSWDTIPTAHHCYVDSLPNTNQWYHIVFTRDTDTLKLYVDNILICFQPTGNNAGYLGYYNTFSIGSRGNTSIQNFIGDIDEVKIFDKVLSQAEITLIDSVCLYATASFAANDTDICEKFCIDFFDSSQNNPTSWLWEFPGGNPSTSTDQNPMNICYNTPGLYDVTLITTNAGGSDTLTLSNFITVYTNPFAPIISQVGNTLTSTPATSYQWQLNSVDIPGATNQSYTITQSGLYTVVIGDDNGCTAQASVDASYVGIAGVDGNSFVNVFPNPSSGSFMVEWSNGPDLVGMVGEVSIDVVNTLGQKVFSSSESRSIGTLAHFKKEIDLGDVARGVYFIEIKTMNEYACPACPDYFGDFFGVRKKILIVK